MSMDHKTHKVEIAGLIRRLPLFEVKPGLKIAILNILGDTKLVQACSSALAERLQGITFDVLITAEAKSIPLAHALSVQMDKPYVVLRKTYKPYMGVSMMAETQSITTGKPQTLFLDEKDLSLVDGKQVILLDDVISTGSTLKGMELVMEKAGATIVAQAAIFTEGDQTDWENVIALGHLPLFLE